MAIYLSAEWNGMTPQLYDQMRKAVDWDNDMPDGFLFHAVAFSDEGLRVTDIWESEGHLQRYLEGRLNPVLRELGIETQPKLVSLPLYRASLPGFERDGS